MTVFFVPWCSMFLVVLDGFTMAVSSQLRVSRQLDGRDFLQLYPQLKNQAGTGWHTGRQMKEEDQMSVHPCRYKPRRSMISLISLFCGSQIMGKPQSRPAGLEGNKEPSSRFRAEVLVVFNDSSHLISCHLICFWVFEVWRSNSIDFRLEFACFQRPFMTLAAL